MGDDGPARLVPSTVAARIDLGNELEIEAVVKGLMAASADLPPE
jgi:hypothetical protein